MSAPMTLRKFEALAKSHGCYVDKTKKEWCVRTSTGGFLLSIAVTHGKQEVLPCYWEKFLKKVK